MKKILLYCLCFNIFLIAFSQQNEIAISGKFDNVAFKDFAETIEKSANLTFYFRDEWVKDITVSFAGTNLKLDNLLANLLINKNLGFYIENRSIYIYPGSSITSELPVYKNYRQQNLNNGNTKDSLTNTERKYLEGKMIAATEVITVGSKQKTISGATCIVNGKIIDETTSEPLIGATVYVEEIKTGTVTDVDGRFKLVLVPGKYKIVINYMSMKQLEYYLQVYSGGNIAIEMKKELIEIGEAKVVANFYDKVKGMQMGYDRISAKTIKEIPVVMGEKDILKVVQMLPGVKSVGEGSSGFNIRGSSTDQNLFYINKIPVYNTSHLFGFFSAFSPDIINDFTLYKSNIPAKYGGRIASVFDISTRQGSKKKFFGQGGISPVTAHCSFEAPVIKDKLSLVTSFRSSYSNWILKKVKDLNVKKSKAYFYDVTLALNANINDKNLLKIFGYNSSDDFSLSTINDYHYSNTGASISWKHIYSSSLTSDISLVYSRYLYENTDKNNISEAFTHNYFIDHYEAGVNFSLITHFNHRIEFGTSEILYDLNRGKILPYGEESIRTPVNLGKDRGLEGAFYVSDEFSLFPSLSLQGGIRYSYFAQLGPAVINKYYPENIRIADNISGEKVFTKGQVVKFYSGPEYRVALNYVLNNDNSLKTSYNRMYQYIYMLSNTIAISPDDQWKLCDYYISPPVSDQVSLGFYHNFRKSGINGSIEIYRKWIGNKVEYKDGTNFTSETPVETQVLQGDQKIYGLEVMFNKNAGIISGWLSYSYSRSFVKVNGDLEANRINKGMTYPSNYDMPHSFNLVMNYRTNRRLSFSANFVYSTGRPVTYPVAVYYSEGQQLVYFSERNKYRIPDYMRMDLSINLEGSLLKEKPLHSFWMINLYNVLGRKNAYSVYYAAENGIVEGKKLSIFAVPIFTISWNYKFGNYLNN